VGKKSGAFEAPKYTKANFFRGLAADPAGRPYSRGKTHLENREKLQCGPMSNVMAALPNIGGALCSTPQSLADAHYQGGMQ